MHADVKYYDLGEARRLDTAGEGMEKRLVFGRSMSLSATCVQGSGMTAGEMECAA